MFCLNPNFLYLQSAPLDEVLAVSMATVSMYFIFLWSKYKYIPSLVFAALFAFFGSLTRYEIWFLLFAEIFFVYVVSLLDSDHGKKLKNSQGYLILFATLALFGVALWLFYNLLGWGDPLYFLHHPGGHIDQQKEFRAQNLLPTEGNLLLSFTYLFSNILEDIGPALLISALISVLYILLHPGKIKEKLYALVSLAPLGFLFLSLYLGITVLFTKTFPLPGTTKLFNVRYGIIALLPAVILLATALSSLWSKRIIKLIVPLFMLIIIFFDITYFIHYSPVAVIDDGKYGISSYGQADEDIISKKMRDNCADGLTLISANQDEIVMFETKFSMKSFVYEGSGKYWTKALLSPESTVNCILMAKKGPIWDNFIKHPERIKNFKTIYTSTSGDTKLIKNGSKENKK